MNLLKTLLCLFYFTRLSVVEEGGGAQSEAVEQTSDTVAATQETPEDAVLSELGLSDEPKEQAPENGAEAGKEDGEKANPEEGQSAEQKADAEKPAPEKKEALSDADLAPLDSKNPKTNERFQKVTEGYKQEKARADAAAAELEKYKGSFESLRSLGFQDEHAADDLVQFAGYRNILATGDVAAFREVMAAQVKQFEQMHGKRVQIEASALDDFQDLKDKVSNYEMSEDDALEIARIRTNKQRTEQVQQAQRAGQETEQARQESIQSAIGQVGAMEAAWRKSDPDAAVLIPQLKAQMEDIARNFPPEQWPQVVKMQWTALKKAAAEFSNKDTGTARPLRAAGHTAGLLEPTNPQDAVLQALGLND